MWKVFVLTVSIVLINSTVQSYFIAAPNVFRVDVEETIYIHVSHKISLELYIQDPRSSKVICHLQRNLDKDKPEIVKLKVKGSDLPQSWSHAELQYKLVVKGSGLFKETPILVDLKRGTTLIQTDKPIYTPGEKVKYRIIPVDMELRPLEENVMIEIKNPQGILVRRQKNVKAWEKGFHSGEFSLGDIPVLGTWQIIAFFGLKNLRNSSSTFVVKKYVLPKFKVQIKPPPFMAPRRNMKRFSIKVSAKYSHGKFVNGLARLKIFVKQSNGGKDILIDDQKSSINGDETYVFDYDKLSLPKEFLSVPFGDRLKIVAEVTERATGTKEVAVDNSVQIVKTPFEISFEKTMKYFKPGIVFKVGVTLRYPNKRPVKNEELMYKYSYGGKNIENVVKTDENGDAYFVINTPYNAQPIIVKVETQNTAFEKAAGEMMVKPYESRNGNYIAVRPYQKQTKAAKFKVGSDIDIEFLVVSRKKEVLRTINYMVIAKGKIVDHKSISSRTETSTVQLTITPHMEPKCRVVAFYVQDGEAVSDAILLDIEDEYENKVSIQASPDKTLGRFAPAYPIYMKIKTESKSVVGLLAVDESVYYLRNESRLTNEKVFSEIGNFDLGCGLGSGKNNVEVFENAGLAVISDSLASTTRKRTDLSCDNGRKSRRRRSLNPDSVVKKCCKSECCQNFYSSRARLHRQMKCDSFRSRVEESCWDDFLECCQKILEIRGRTINNEAFQEDNPIDLLDEAQIHLRDNFPQSWMWFDLETSENGLLEKDYTIPDSITTWEITALAINNKTGFGISKASLIKSFLDLFVYIKMPYSAQRYEQITVYAVIYNYYHAPTRAQLYLKGHQRFCSIAEAGENSPIIKVIVPANDGIAIPFTIIPLHIGEIPIEFVVKTENGGDRILKKLTVEPEGVSQQDVFSILLDPQGIKQDEKIPVSGSFEQRRKNFQVNSKNITLPDPFVPESQKAMVYVTGNLMSAGVEDIIKNGLGNLIKLPTGCGEQTMIGMAPLVYVLRYLYSMKNGVTADVERKAYDFMRKGYNNELKWRRSDHSYSVWGNKTPPSTWLTAFVNKVFCQATRYIKEDIDNNVICDTLKLLEKIQEADGSFPEEYPVRHKEMIGGVTSKLSLTAFVLISLMECHSQCIKADSQTIVKASQFLNSQIPTISSGYIMSLVSYALVLSNDPKKTHAYRKLTGMLSKEIKYGRERKYINDGGPALKVESTAYTLLTMVALNKMEDAGPLVVWLTEHRNSRGSFYSTQDTVIALQALSEYCSKTTGNDLDLKVTITAEKKNIKKTIYLSDQNALVRQEFEVTGAIPGLITVDTEGTGTAQLQIEVMYNRPTKKGENCEYIVEVEGTESSVNVLNDATPVKNWKTDEKFQKRKKQKLKKCKKRCKRKFRRNRNAKKKCVKKCKKQAVEKKQSDQVANRMNVEVCLSHRFSNGSSMTIAEVGILTGFKADEKSVKKLLSDDRDPKIQHYEINDRFVVLYLQKIPKVRSCFSLAFDRDFSVGVLQSVPVTIYDYYEPGNKCTKFYGPKAGSELLKTICDGSECVCSQDICAKERSTDPEELKKWACKHSDFAIFGQVRDIEDEGSWQKITLRVAKVYKKGKKDLKPGEKIHILQQKSCDQPSLQNGDKIVLMLKEEPVFVLNKSAFVLKWPKDMMKIRQLQLALEDVKLGHYCG